MINFRQYDLDKKLPFKDENFDGITCIQVAFALPRINYTFSEFYRVLKEGGIIIIVEPKPDANMGRLIFAQFREVNKLKGLKRIKAYIRNMSIMPFGLIVLFLNLIMNIWEKQNKYHFYDYNKIKLILFESGFKVIKKQNILANQDTLIVATK